jgi:hypothetical protein
MATQHHIDRNRVYLGGFSMGGMFTYHAMNRIPDLIAAFCPVSGYPMGGATANANVRPIPILHIHGTGDGTCAFSGVQPALNVWINHNGCPTTARVINSYNGFAGAKLHIWGPGNDNVEVRLLELADKGHWICKEPQVYTGKEIWNFCKNYSLNNTRPIVSITSPVPNYTVTCFAPTGESAFPDITINATASDPNGTVAKMDFFDGETLIASCTTPPYSAVFSGSSGTHTIKVVATDNDGEEGYATVKVYLLAPQVKTLSASFTQAGCVPKGWTTYDSSEKRIGYASGFNQGCRILQFTGSPRGLDYGLYFRNINGNEKQGWAKYGLSDAGEVLTLTPGHYVLKYKICNWNRPSFSPVELCIEKGENGTCVAQHTYTPTVNIGNNPSNSFSNLTAYTFEFDITEKAEYVIAAYSASESWSDCILGQLVLGVSGYTNGIETMPLDMSTPNDNSAMYNLQGCRLTGGHQAGIIIQNGKKIINR